MILLNVIVKIKLTVVLLVATVIFGGSGEKCFRPLHRNYTKSYETNGTSCKDFDNNCFMDGMLLCENSCSQPSDYVTDNVCSEADPEKNDCRMIIDSQSYTDQTELCMQQKHQTGCYSFSQCCISILKQFCKIDCAQMNKIECSKEPDGTFDSNTTCILTSFQFYNRTDSTTSTIGNPTTTSTKPTSTVTASVSIITTAKSSTSKITKNPVINSTTQRTTVKPNTTPAIITNTTGTEVVKTSSNQQSTNNMSDSTAAALTSKPSTTVKATTPSKKTTGPNTKPTSPSTTTSKGHSLNHYIEYTIILPIIIILTVVLFRK